MRSASKSPNHIIIRHDLGRVLPVHAYSTPDVVGVIVEAGLNDRPWLVNTWLVNTWLVNTLRQLSCKPLAGSAVPEKIRDAAVARVYRASSETSALFNLVLRKPQVLDYY
ncbi:hypothetical protein CCYS_01900 [Corynebacterium cystitidis DSM 20524]|uniref:Uncharacterized protein n=1 Tax=Corynebacterium cystitidis DSM 20524 TaxID=1121357 RepID=A0A1H9W0B2_9CORY|nr:hypothetical protein CCYS_01900 [Corynebacterium cystitidis DSM 20524]SES27332.1 hypothetical protein SAMN05661109_02481 [Corynebacterium cystitidis DSM 20524]SNV88171.1 Uncharacterised protein [Corynebacterium cystitidis]